MFVKPNISRLFALYFHRFEILHYFQEKCEEASILNVSFPRFIQDDESFLRTWYRSKRLSEDHC
jgi:hypothetical protein